MDQNVAHAKPVMEMIMHVCYCQSLKMLTFLFDFDAFCYSDQINVIQYTF